MLISVFKGNKHKYIKEKRGKMRTERTNGLLLFKTKKIIVFMKKKKQKGDGNNNKKKTKTIVKVIDLIFRN